MWSVLPVSGTDVITIIISCEKGTCIWLATVSLVDLSGRLVAALGQRF